MTVSAGKDARVRGGGVSFAILGSNSSGQAKTHYVKRSSLWFASFVKYNMQFRSLLNFRDSREKKKKLSPWNKNQTLSEIHNYEWFIPKRRQPAVWQRHYNKMYLPNKPLSLKSPKICWYTVPALLPAPSSQSGSCLLLCVFQCWVVIKTHGHIWVPLPKTSLARRCGWSTGLHPTVRGD